MSPRPTQRSSNRSGTPQGASEQGAEGLLGQQAYERLRDILLREEGFDLDGYRSSYLARRLRARLGVVQVPPASYPALVGRDPDERRALMETLGVNVSAFFRDAPTWIFLEEETIPDLLATQPRGGAPFRAASLGCAGGQEAYSLAMVLRELTRGRGPRFEVDAFDVDPDALAVAREARYPRAALGTLAEAAIERYFEEDDAGELQVNAELRTAVRVERRDLLTESLPRGYDLVLCRNMMIYLAPDAKNRLLQKIQESLRPGGVLVLGQSEVLQGPAAEHFTALNARHRVYRKGA